MSVRIYVIRHGEVEHHREDVHLTERGRLEAIAAGRALAQQVGSAPGEHVAIFHSPVTRVRETAELLQEGLRGALSSAGRLSSVTVATPQIDEALSNVRFIISPGCPPEEPSLLYAETADPAQQHRFSTQQAAFLQGFWSSVDPMGYWLTRDSGGVAETPATVLQRLRARLAAIAGSNRPTAASATHFWLVTHSGAMRALLRAVFGADLGEPAYCGVITFTPSEFPTQLNVQFGGRLGTLQV